MFVRSNPAGRQMIADIAAAVAEICDGIAHERQTRLLYTVLHCCCLSFSQWKSPVQTNLSFRVAGHDGSRILSPLDMHLHPRPAENGPYGAVLLVLCCTLHTSDQSWDKDVGKARVYKTCRPLSLYKRTTSWPHAVRRASKSSSART